MPYYRMNDPEFFDKISAPSLQWTRDLARSGGLEVGPILMGNPGEPIPMVQILQIPPGGSIPKHAHATHRVEIVLHGNLTLPDGSVIGPGDVMISEPGEYYGPNVAGHAGATTAEIFADCTAPTTFADASMAATQQAAAEGVAGFRDGAA